MTPWEIKNKIEEIRSYIVSPYFHPSQSKKLYADMERLEKMLEELKNGQQKTEDKRKED